VARRVICPPPTAVRRWQKSRRIYVRPRTGPQSAHLWWPAVAKLQAASVPIAWAAAPWDRQTDGSRYSKMLPPLRRCNSADDKLFILFKILQIIVFFVFFACFHLRQSSVNDGQCFRCRASSCRSVSYKATRRRLYLADDAMTLSQIVVEWRALALRRL